MLFCHEATFAANLRAFKCKTRPQIVVLYIHHMIESHHMINTHNIEHTWSIFRTSPADIFTPSCLDPHWPAGHLRSKHISYSWYDGQSSYYGTPSYDDFPSYENFPSYVIWWIAINSTLQCMMELHHIMMLIHHKLYDSYKLYYCLAILQIHFCNMNK